ncbi:MAG: GxxExxY protein [Daejeonella sp.]|uniref:GxxExxY protein n=1 Tax=Daejeonella sp. TaxID=2805397 RepID=UPI003C738C9E
MEYEQLTHKIIGCAMKVHSKLGPGFPEVVYQRSMAIELEKQALRFIREMTLAVFYDDIRVGYGRVDFFVEDTVMLELKALINLEDAHLAQAMNYCKTFNLPSGILINFGKRSLEFKRVYNLNHQDNQGFISK